MIERLTARSLKNGMAYLVKVKNHEQDLEGSYNTLMCITEAFERLAQYEDLREQMEAAFLEGDKDLALKLSQELDQHIVEQQRRIMDGK